MKYTTLKQALTQEELAEGEKEYSRIWRQEIEREEEQCSIADAELQAALEDAELQEYENRIDDE